MPLTGLGSFNYPDYLINVGRAGEFEIPDFANFTAPVALTPSAVAPPPTPVFSVAVEQEQSRENFEAPVETFAPVAVTPAAISVAAPFVEPSVVTINPSQIISPVASAPVSRGLLAQTSVDPVLLILAGVVVLGAILKR